MTEANGVDFQSLAENKRQLPGPVNVIELFKLPITDSTGIPLKSDRDDPEVITGINFDYGPSIFKSSPSRYPGGEPVSTPMSRLEQRRLGHAHAEMSVIMEYVKSRMYPLQREDESLNTQQLHNLFNVLRFMPYYLVSRRDNTLQARGEIPPAFIILANGAAGSNAAIGAYSKRFDNDLEILASRPTATELKDAAEDSGEMIGEKSICVASPQQMEQFLNEAIKPPEIDSELSSFEGLLQDDEVASYVKFAVYAASAFSRIEVLKSEDKKHATFFEEIAKTGIFMNPVALELLRSQISEEYDTLLKSIYSDQRYMNLFLGRSAEIDKPKLNEVSGMLGLKMFALLDRLSIQLSSYQEPQVETQVVVERPLMNRAARRAAKKLH
ncbi:MAG TPA: hypothetical protein VG965_02930 [Patescibacteria group bacterium]|nr:hypothetical protein [Patescibacteria group bacterium]